MITLENKTLQADFYKIVTILSKDLGLWTEGNYKNEWGIKFITGEKTSATYIYPSRESAQRDIKELKKFKEKYASIK